MLCNNYAPEIDEQPGDQPIRVWYKELCQMFEDIKVSLQPIDKLNIIKNVKLQFLTENIKVIGPETNGLKIVIHDTFLSFLWAYSYGTMTLIPLRKINEIEGQRAEALLKYAKNLTTEFVEWNKINLPNPELYTNDEMEAIGKGNGIFMKALMFILLHEFAHIFLGHPFEPRELHTLENRIKMEKDADTAAVAWALQSIEEYEHERESIIIGAITALNSLSFLPNTFYNTPLHPSAEDRIAACLYQLDIEDDNYCWLYVLWSIILWQIVFFAFSPLTNIFKSDISHKQKLYNMIEELKEFKRTGINKLYTEI